jgi:hypothetical protein
MQAFQIAQLKLVAVTIIAVSLWLGGFGCSFCCATGVTDACCQDARGLSRKDSCNEDSCCKPSTHTNETTSDKSVSPQGGLRSCSLLPAQMTSLSAEKRISGDLTLASPVTSPLIETVEYAQIEAFTSRPLPRNRGAPYLRCCVLLI